MSEPMIDPLARPRADRVAALAAGVAIAFGVGLALHLRPLNGPWYFPWPWSTGVPWPRPLGVAALVAIVLTAAGLAVRLADRRLWLGLLALGLAGFGLRVGVSALESEPIGLANAAALAEDEHVGSFFTVARAMTAFDWSLERYPTYMPEMPLHAVNKPPGPVLFWIAMLHASRGDEAAALRLGVLMIAAIGAAAAPLTGVVARLLGAPPAAAAHAAGVAALMPGAVLFFPSFDPALATWTLGGAALWFAAVRRGPAWAVAFGAWLAATLFVAFGVLPIGLYLGAAGLWLAMRSSPPRPAIAPLARRAAIALGVAAAGVVAMRLALGYDALETLRVAMDQQRRLMQTYGVAGRPYPQTVWWDLYDASLGVGYAPVVLCVALAARARRDAAGALAAIGLGAWAVVAVAAMLPGETARVWNFLFPLVAIPAGWTLSRASRGAAAACYVAIGVVLVVLVRSVIFLAIAPMR